MNCIKIKSNSLTVSLILGSLLMQACGSQLSDSARLTKNESGSQTLTLDWAAVGLAGLPPITFSLGLLGTVSPPLVGGNKLAADDVYVEGTTAFVSYNLGGANLAGAIDQITNVLNLPLLGASVAFPNTKINGIAKSGSDLYAVGASSGSDGPAVLKKFNVPSTLLPTTLLPTAAFTLGSYAGVGVIKRDSNIYAVSGDDATNGGVTILDTSLNQTTFVAMRDARGIAYSTLGTGNMYVIAAQPGRIQEITTAGAAVRTIALGGAATVESKSNIIVGKTMIAATIGEGGVKLVCRADQQILASLPAPVMATTGLANALTVSNAVAAASGLLFVANGEAGVYVYSMKDSLPAFGRSCNTVTLSLLGSISLGAGLSANNVKYVGGVLYVANGLGGFKLIAVTNLGAIGDNTDFI